MVDAADSKSAALTGVPVRVRPRVPNYYLDKTKDIQKALFYKGFLDGVCPVRFSPIL